MKFLAKLSAALLAGSLSAGELSPGVLRLIGQDTRAMFAVDLDRYRSSILNKFYPWDSERPASEMTGTVVTILSGQREGAAPLTVFLGTSPAAPRDNAIETAVLGPGATVQGDAATVQEAIRRWRQDERAGELALKARSLSESYDNWFLLVKPLESLTHPGLPASKYRDDLIQMVEEVSGGIRLGSLNEIRIEVLMKTADDASGLAALARWAPGFIQLQDTHSMQSMFAGIAENLAVTTEGRTVSISFALPEGKMEDLSKADRVMGEIW
jgi:hypothetical protein